MRNMKTRTNIINERFENILKRNVIGEYNNDTKHGKGNSKLKRLSIAPGLHDDYGYHLEDESKLKIFE